MVSGLITKIRKILVGLSILAVLALPASAIASVYGGGTYGSCPYSTGCAASGTTGTSSQPAAKKPATGIVLLNSFNEFFTSSGKTLDLKAKQVIYFDIVVNGVTERYSLTIDSIGSDSVNFTIRPGPIQSSLNVGDTNQYDANGDGVFDINITLNSIKDGVASMTFSQQSTSQAAPQTPASTTPPAKNSKINWLLIVSITAIVIGSLLFIILFIRRRRKNNQTINY